MVSFSDDGSLVAFNAYVNNTQTGKNEPRCYAFNGQTGKQLWSFSPPSVNPGNGGVQVTKDGAFVAYTNSPFTCVPAARRRPRG